MAIERAPPAPAPDCGEAPRRADTRVITLQHGEHNDATLYRLEKGSVLQFCPGPSLLGRKVFLYTNYVVGEEEGGTESAEFVRSQYYGLEWRRAAEGEGEGERDGEQPAEQPGEPLGAGALLTDTNVVCEIKLTRAGPFHYYFVYDTAECPAGPQGSGWFQVAPSLAAGGEPVPLDAVLCQTVLAKCLGPLPRWTRVLRAAREAGYNMIHFTPVQQLGASGSSYSIAHQLRLDPRYGGDRDATFADVENVVSHIRNEWKMLSICDVVLNHTANETAWLAEHPEATYNARDCPHLRPAALLDAALARLAADVARGALAPAVPPALTRPDQVEALRPELARRLDELRLHECYQCDVADIVQQFLARARNRVPPPPDRADSAAEPLRLAPDPQRRRRAATVDLERALRLYNSARADCADEEMRLRACCDELRAALDALNDAARAATRDHLQAAVDNCLAGIRYHRLQADGPKIAEVSERHPLVPRYFRWARGVEALSAERAEALVWGEEGRAVMAHNGWVMGADPLQDFAAREQDARVYLRRELIAWGDSVKLRYGARPEECPFLWAHMREYVELTAEIFDGLRLDNCHSTPLHVAEYMLDCARNVKPELYVAAELFTNSDHLDNIFVNRLGVTSLIREAQSAWDSHEQGRLVHRFGGQPVGAFLRPPRRPAAPCTAHAMLLDLTHDNPAPITKRSVFDYLPTAALVAMACCATGSTRGYDELVPHHIHVVEEERLYAEWSEGGAGGEGGEASEGGEVAVREGSGIVAGKRLLNKLHAELARGGYSEVFVDQMDPDTVAVTRHHPVTRKSVILVARTAFGAPNPHEAPPPPRDLRFEGELDEILFEIELRHRDHKNGGAPFSGPGAHTRHPAVINGLAEYECVVRRGGAVAQSGAFAGASREGALSVLRWRRLPAGGVVALRVSPGASTAAALAALHRALHAPAAHDADPLQLAPHLAALDAADLHALLYRCEAEERDATGGAGGVYSVPGHGPLVYAGLQGAASLLAAVRLADDLGHPLCANLRAGDWLADYCWRRLEAAGGRLAAPAAAVRRALEPLRALPRFLQPAYFDAVLRALHGTAMRAALARLAPWCRSDPLPRALALTSVQLVGRVSSAPLPGVSGAASMSAGLPHFAAGYMRCWGRDTFVALRGLLLLTGRASDARDHIVGFGACLRHGLIPNLLDGGARARYNCRDAVWWWLLAIKQYCTEVEGGFALLQESVPRLFPRDDSEPQPPDTAPRQPLHRVMQEALDAHFQGRVFRERRAGRDIDAHMTDPGFTVQIGVQPDTGFVFGGNDHNCGTWMDKMGSSERAGNRGKPASPRDGAAVEIVGLCYAVVSWLSAEHAAGRYPHAGVARVHSTGAATTWSWAQWAERLRCNFERHFWVPAEPSAADERPDLVHRRAVYKDTHGASRPWADYQLRCNYAVAMAVAPELFDARHAALALDAVERHLLAPLGLKTLDPADWNYRPDYDNANDSDDPTVAHGFNYHQGPEWLWPLGFYLRARLRFAARGQQRRAAAAVLSALGPLAAELRGSPWRGLPELTNAGGKYCDHSCRSQAWSSAVIIEVLHELRAMRRAAPLE